MLEQIFYIFAIQKVMQKSLHWSNVTERIMESFTTLGH